MESRPRKYPVFRCCSISKEVTIKGGDSVGVAEEIQEQLLYKDLFTIGGIAIPSSVVVTWGVMVFLVVFSIIMTRHMKLVPTGNKQLLIEKLVEMLYNAVYGLIGEKGKRYIPYLVTVMLYLGVANMVGMFGIKPPTKDLNTTLGLALMSIVLVQYAGIHEKGVGGWVKAFTHPIAMITPMNILELGIKPLSLCMRLFGNVLGAFIIMELIKFVCPLFVPMVLSMYFDIFDGCLQAYVFVFLTSLYIQEAIE